MLGRARRLEARAATVADVRAAARKSAPRAVFDYVDGAAESESSYRRSREAFERVRFAPRTLVDVSTVDTSASILGRLTPLPIAFAPTGFTRMMHHEGEVAAARAAAAAGLPFCLSTMGTTSIEDLRAATPEARLWFQLYLWRNRAQSEDLIDRARAAGYDTLVLTVDTPVAGLRLRDVRNGLTIPPALTPRTVANMARFPRWWFNKLTTAPLEFASLSSFDGTVAELGNKIMDPSITPGDLSWLRSRWPGHLVVKGITTGRDAEVAVDGGADAVVVSNHGGRQLDRALTPLEQLGEVIEAVDGRAQVFVDGGILSGSDVAAAVGLGADACLIGRAYLYGLMASAEDGVRIVLDILRKDLIRCMQLTGARDLRELRDDRVRLPHAR